MNKEDKKIIELSNIQNLPYDIKYKIYHDYFIYTNLFNNSLNLLKEYQLIYEDIIRALKSTKSVFLNTSEILPYVDIITDDKNLTKFVCSKNRIFKEIYIDHYKYGRNCFIDLDINESLALSWLMYLYR